MFQFILFHLLKFKIHAITAAKIPLIATLLVLGTTGFVVTGTISGGDEDDKTVNLVIKPLESKKCVDALIAQTETLLQLDVLAGDATAQLRRMRERARESADDQNKLLDETAVLTQFNTSSAKIREALAAARQDVFHAADLGRCQDGDAATSVDLDIAVLQARYDQILRDFGVKVSGFLTEAQTAFDALVRNAPQKPPKQGSQGSGSHSSD